MRRGVFFIFLAAVGLRVTMFTSGKSIWGDEWMDVFLSQTPVAETFWGAIHDVHPPLYFLLLKGVVSVFGPNEWSFRSLSFLAGLGTLLCLYAVGKELMGRSKAMLALFFAAISPYWLQPSNEIRGYSLLGFLTIFGTWLFLKAVREPAKGAWRWGFAVTAVAALYTEHYAWLWLFGMFIFALYAAHRKELRITSWIPVIVMIALCGLPSLGLIYYQAVYRESAFDMHRLKEYLVPMTLAKKAIGLFWHFACGYVFSMLSWERVAVYLKSSWAFWLSAATTAASIFLMARGWAQARRESAALWALTGLIFVAPLTFLLIVYPIRLEARYVTFAAPYFFLLLAFGIASVKSRAIRTAAIVLVATTALYGCAYTIMLKTDPVHKEDYIGLAGYLAKNAGPRDAILNFKEQVKYYNRQANDTLQAPHFSDLVAFEQAGAGNFERIFYVFYRNMTPSVTERINRETREGVAPLGLTALGEPVVFGGEEGLLCVYIFQKGGSRVS